MDVGTILAVGRVLSALQIPFVTPGFEPLSRFPATRSTSWPAVFFLVVPDRARLSRLCRWWPRPCSRRVPAGLLLLSLFHPKLAEV